ncbi:MAG: GNAT family N-acetyltransferase [Ekhidna sp.]
MHELVIRNFELHATRIPSLSRAMEVYDENGITYVDSGLSCDTFNIIHINRSDIEENAISKAVNHFRSKQFEFCLWANDQFITSELRTELESLDLSEQSSEVGMVLDLDHYRPDNDSDDERIKQVKSDSEMQVYAQTIAKNWSPMDQNVVTYYDLTSQLYLDPSNGIELFIYYHEGEPVSTVELFATDHTTVGLYGFTTLEAYRGLGIGSALMRHSLNRAKHLGFKQAILQATEDGIGIYKKMGFEAINKYYEYG